MSNLIERLLDIGTTSKFNLSGSFRQLKELKELVSMIESIPSGRQLLNEALNSGLPSKISFVSGFEDDKEVKGRFYRDTREIKIVKIDTNLPEMSEEARLKSKIMMASMLAHELQHCIDISRNTQLDMSASNVNEAVVAPVLSEMNAYLREAQVGVELRTKHNLSPKIYIYHHPGDPKNIFRRASGPTDPLYIQYGGIELHESTSMTPKHKKETMKKALSGEIPKIKKYIDQRRMQVAQNKSFPPSTPAFKSLVENYLKHMEINMPFEEVMSYAKESLKSRPNPKAAKDGPGR